VLKIVVNGVNISSIRSHRGSEDECSSIIRHKVDASPKMPAENLRILSLPFLFIHDFSFVASSFSLDAQAALLFLEQQLRENFVKMAIKYFIISFSTFHLGECHNNTKINHTNKCFLRLYLDKMLFLPRFTSILLRLFI
jgi:hypothetical protein